jgi:hypothetical protein
MFLLSSTERIPIAHRTRYLYACASSVAASGADKGLALRLPFEIMLPTALSILVLLRAAWQRLKMLPARAWPTMQGTVVGTTVSSQHGIIPTHLVQVAYTYTVNGGYYSGFYGKTFLRKRSAERFATNVKGQIALLHYAPGLPDRSSLIEREQYGWPQ